MEDLLKVTKEKPDDVELVITGRKADPKIIESADRDNLKKGGKCPLFTTNALLY